MVRMSDARMSGTSYGACVLHVAPEAYVGGPLALVGRAISSQSMSRRGASTCMCRREELAPPQGRLVAADAALRARLRLDVRPAYPAGERGLRFRFPARRFRAAGGEPAIF